MGAEQQNELRVLEASYEEYRNFQFSEFTTAIKVSLGCAVVLLPFLMIFKGLFYSLLGSLMFGAGIFLLLLLFASYKHFMHCRKLKGSYIDVLQRHIQQYPLLGQFVANQVKKNGHLVKYDAAFVALASEQYKKKQKLNDIARERVRAGHSNPAFSQHAGSGQNHQ